MVEVSHRQVMDWLRDAADPVHRAGLARYGIPIEPALGVPMGEIKRAAKRFGPAHDIVFSLWKTGIYEARVMAVHLADPDLMTRREADGWTRDFDNWAICDTAAFHLFDRTPFRWEAACDWARDKREYVRRAGFATLWGLSVHDKAAPDEKFVAALDWASEAADDTREPVKKAIDMALRAVGKRNAALNIAASRVAEELAARSAPSARWIGRHALKELSSVKVRQKLDL